MKSPKIGKLNIDTLILPHGLLIHEKKKQTKKSHATVPLNNGHYTYICPDSEPFKFMQLKQNFVARTSF